jgi:hypothetical protein
MIRQDDAALAHKAQDTTDLHIATAGRATFQMGPFAGSDYGRLNGHDLVQRYGMWVARCVSLNAQAAAGVPFKLMRVERNESLRKDCLRAGLWRRPSARTMAHLEGKLGCQPSSTVRKSMTGNFENLVEVDQHPILDLLHKSNSWTSGCQYRTGLYSDLQIFGKAYDVLFDETLTTEMWSMRPQKTKPIKHARDFGDPLVSPL